MTKLTIRQRIALEANRALQKQKAKEHRLTTLFWESTLRCNLKCLHCGSDCKVASLTPDMPFEDLEPVLDSIARRYDPRTVFVIISGGEPLMRADLDECGRKLRERGFPWGMVTNGFALTPERLERLVANGLRSISVSLDGLEEDHDWMRGRPTSFVRASEAIAAICRYNETAGTPAANNAANNAPNAAGPNAAPARPRIGFDAITCVNRRNLPHLPEIKEHLLSLGCRAWRVFPIVPMGRAREVPEFRLTGEEIRQTLDFIRETRREGIMKVNYACEDYLAGYEGEVRDTLFACDAGVSVGSVLIDGSVSACTSIRSDYVQGNIYKEDFMDIWDNRFQKYRDHSWMRTGECADCPHFRYCQGNGMHLRDDQGRILQCNLRLMED